MTTCSGIRYKMGWSSTTHVKDSVRWYLGESVKLRIRESVHLKTVLELHDMEIHQKISMPNYQKLYTMVKRRKDQKLRLRNFDARHGRKSKLSTCQESKGIKWRWRRKMFLLPVERKQTNVRRETSAVSGMRVTIVHKNRTRKPPHILSHQWQEVDVCRGKEVSEAKVTMVPFFDSRAEIIWKVLARDRLVNIGILCKAGDKCPFPHHKVDEEPNKKPKKTYNLTKKEEKTWTKML